MYNLRHIEEKVFLVHLLEYHYSHMSLGLIRNVTSKFLNKMSLKSLLSPKLWANRHSVLLNRRLSYHISLLQLPQKVHFLPHEINVSGLSDANEKCNETNSNFNIWNSKTRTRPPDEIKFKTMFAL